MSNVPASIHNTAQVLQDFSTIICYLHVLALLIINTTKTPKSNFMMSKAYKMLEILAGLLTPLAKR
jgi:hypothetical protein